MTYDQLLQLVQTVNEKYNEILQNAKKINELISQGVFEPTSLVAVWNPATSRTENLPLQMVVDAIINGNNALVNQLISIGEILIDGNDVTIPSGVNWVIQGIPYFTTTDSVFTVPFASAGNTRIDIIVANTSGVLVRYPGTETSGIGVRPNIPLNTVLVTQINVTEDAFNAIDTGLTINELGAIHNSNTPSSDNPFATLSNVNNFVRTLRISEAALSGTGTIEEQICEYILALPEELRTIPETDSKWNVLIIDTPLPTGSKFSSKFSPKFN